MARTQYQTQLRQVKPGANPSINTPPVYGVTDDAWKPGAILTQYIGGRCGSLATTLDSNTAYPLKYIALDEFKGGATEQVGVLAIKDDAVFEAQVYTSAATVADIGKRGTLIQDATTGHYAVSVGAANPIVEIVDVEPNFSPASAEKANSYNKVWFKFLPAALEKAPVDQGS